MSISFTQQQETKQLVVSIYANKVAICVKQKKYHQNTYFLS